MSANVAKTPRSLAYRLTVWYALSSFALVLAATGFLYWALARNLDRANDRLLANLVLPVVNLLRSPPADREAIRRQIELGRLGRQEPSLYVRVLDERQRPLAETPSIGLVFERSQFPAPQHFDGEPVAGRTVQTAAEQWFRIAAFQVGTAYTVQAALDRTHEEQLLADYRWNLLSVLLAAMLICTMASYQLARRGVRPVRAIADAARRIGLSTLGERINLADSSAELQTLANTFNAMLERLEASFTRLDQFAADLAHELRTPIGNLRGEAEVALSKVRTAAEYQELLGSALEEYERLARLIDDLLFLARADQPAQQLAREAVDVGLELEKTREFYEPLAAEAGVRLHVSCPPKTSARLSRTLLQRALGNLVANALRHTPARGSVSLSATWHDDVLQIDAADTGVGIDAVHLPHVFDRFYRATAACGPGAAGNVGLGLAIVKSIALLHGGSVAAASEVGKGTTITMYLPQQRMS